MFTTPLAFAIGLGGLLAAFAAAPVLIHLINMMRHRRVKWAAMEFLLQSYKKHRNWIWLKQLLLLAMRMTAMVMLALMLCTLVHYLLRGLGWFNVQIGGDAPTHHYVLLDDSLSMSDRDGGELAFDRATNVIGSIADRAAQRQNQRFTLIRYSRAAQAVTSDENDAAVSEIADINGALVDADFNLLLEEKRRAFDVSELSVGPGSALRAVTQLIDGRLDEQAIVYLVSDYRRKDWNNPAETTTALEELKKAKADVQLISCVRSEQSNLAIVAVSPAPETRAAGVPLFVQVSVRNFGNKPAKKVQLQVRTRYYDPQDAAGGEPEQNRGEEDDLPVVLIEDIQPGTTVARRVQVYFPKPGRHVVEASLSDHAGDSIIADSRRFCVIDFPESVPVLIIDGHPENRNAYYLESAFRPGERTNTGVRPMVRTAAFLRDESLETLKEFHAVYLLDVPRLDDRAIGNLEAYVRQGGGLAFFAGDRVEASATFYNSKLYRDGEGLFPIELDALQTDNLLVSEPDLKVPDIQVFDHPIFSVFLGERNSLIRLVSIEHFLQVKRGWTPPADSTVEVAARLRTGQPLVVDHKFGDGRAVAFLTTLAPDWNNWGNDPSMVVVALKLQSHLAAGRHSDLPVVVGNPISLTLQEKKHVKDVSFVVPGPKRGSWFPIDRLASKRRSDADGQDALMVASLSSGETFRSGVYDGWYYTTDGKIEMMRWAVNVEPSEGELTLVEPRVVLSKLDNVKPQFLFWDEYDPNPVDQAGMPWSKYLLFALIGLLAIEQIVAYATSYHPVRGGAR